MKLLVLISIFCSSIVNANQSTYMEFKELLSQQLSVCEAYQLTEKGYLSFSHSRQYRNYWSIDMIVNKMIPEFAKRDKIDLRDSLSLTASHASSAQSANALLRAAKIMHNLNIKKISRKAFLEATEEIYAKKKKIEKVFTCTNIKWGNFYPDFHAWPIYQSTWNQIHSVFNNRPRLSQKEKDKAKENHLNYNEMIELKALGKASIIFESQFEFLKNDIGGFKGNPIAIYGNGDKGEFVCTDEMTSHTLFIQLLQKHNLLKYFNIKNGKYAHRRPRLFGDHFGIMLFNSSNRAVIYDPWLRDGGKFPIFSSIDSWFNKNEIEDQFFEAQTLDQKANVTIVKDDRKVPRKDDGKTNGFNFDLTGLGQLRRIY